MLFYIVTCMFHGVLAFMLMYKTTDLNRSTVILNTAILYTVFLLFLEGFSTLGGSGHTAEYNFVT